jgi:hypothetical protein
MKAQLKVRPNLIVELDGDKQSDLFRVIASAQEVFAEKRCGKCKGTDLRFRVRKNNQAQEFFELLCLGCGAVLSFGVHKNGGTLFPHRLRDVDGGGREWLPDDGWVRWDRDRQAEV